MGCSNSQKKLTRYDKNWYLYWNNNTFYSGANAA